jgi:hypothetical protein
MHFRFRLDPEPAAMVVHQCRYLDIRPRQGLQNIGEEILHAAGERREVLSNVQNRNPPVGICSRSGC